MAEQGILPDNGEALIRKIEDCLGIVLLKRPVQEEPKPVVMTEQDKKLERLRLAALQNQAAGICQPPVDQKGGTTTITLTTNSTDV
jgi:hypothetical protein